MNLTRRNFLKIAGAATVSGKIFSHGTVDAATGRYATIIDLTRCDGCKEELITKIDFQNL
jgi:formylmethanofuran dehydrogenase subunit E